MMLNICYHCLIMSADKVDRAWPFATSGGDGHEESEPSTIVCVCVCVCGSGRATVANGNTNAALVRLCSPPHLFPHRSLSLSRSWLLLLHRSHQQPPLTQRPLDAAGADTLTTTAGSHTHSAHYCHVLVVYHAPSFATQL